MVRRLSTFHGSRERQATTSSSQKLIIVCRLQVQALSKGIALVRRHYPSVSAVLSDHPSTTLLINCTGIGSLKLSDINDTNLYPTRGQTLLVAEPKTPISRMYEMERVKYDSAIYLPFLTTINFL